MTTKTIKISLLEKKFKKLHTMVDFAKESCQAILFHSKRLAELNPTELTMAKNNAIALARNRGLNESAS